MIRKKPIIVHSLTEELIESISKKNELSTCDDSTTSDSETKKEFTIANETDKDPSPLSHQYPSEDVSTEVVEKSNDNGEFSISYCDNIFASYYTRLVMRANNLCGLNLLVLYLEMQ